MAIMVASFRVSVDDWLKQILPADLYLRTASGGDARPHPRGKGALAHTPGIARADFIRTSQLTLDPTRPSVGLIARPIDAAEPGNVLPLTNEVIATRHPPQRCDTDLGIRSDG